MFRSIASRITKDKDYPDRTFTLEVYDRILEGAFYDHLESGFHQEMSAANEYVPLRDRRPSVRYGLCKLVVDDSVALLFSEGHFPTAECSDEPVKEALADLIKDMKLNQVMLETATTGSVGSVALHLRILAQDDGRYRPFVEIKRTSYLTPTYDPKAPDRLIKVREQYKVTGEALRERGYSVEDSDLPAWFWFAREWDSLAETWFLPWKLKDTEAKPDQIDTARTVTHSLGFVPWLWIRNLPGDLKLLEMQQNGSRLRFSDIDGACTFAGAIDAMIEIDYQLSQAGRGLKYSMDPLLMIKEPAATAEGFVRSPANAMLVGEKGDARLLEIGGSAFTVVLDYVRALRELGLESVHGNRTDPQKLSAATSGRAMELMNQALIWLADKLRVSYGEGALLSLLKMVIAAHQKYPLTVKGKQFPKIPESCEVTLRWPAWYHPTSTDRRDIATTLSTHKNAGHMSRETAVKTIAADYDVEDVKAELARIEADQTAEVALVPAPKGQVKTEV
jgi:hypothetical protein